MRLRARVVDGHAARLLLLLLRGVVRGEIRRTLLPRLPMVARTEEILRAEVERAALRRAHVDGRVPVEAQLRLLVAGQRLDVANLVRLPIDPSDVAALRLGVDVG